jgi:hypothetical protein
MKASPHMVGLSMPGLRGGGGGSPRADVRKLGVDEEDDDTGAGTGAGDE